MCVCVCRGRPQKHEQKLQEQVAALLGNAAIQQTPFASVACVPPHTARPSLNLHGVAGPSPNPVVSSLAAATGYVTQGSSGGAAPPSSRGHAVSHAGAVPSFAALTSASTTAAPPSSRVTGGGGGVRPARISSAAPDARTPVVNGPIGHVSSGFPDSGDES